MFAAKRLKDEAASVKGGLMEPWMRSAWIDDARACEGTMIIVVCDHSLFAMLRG